MHESNYVAITQVARFYWFWLIISRFVFLVRIRLFLEVFRVFFFDFLNERVHFLHELAYKFTQRRKAWNESARRHELTNPPPTGGGSKTELTRERIFEPLGEASGL